MCLDPTDLSLTHQKEPSSATLITSLICLQPCSWAIRCWSGHLGQRAKLKVTTKPLFTYCDSASKRQKERHSLHDVPFPSPATEQLQAGASGRGNHLIPRRLLPLYGPVEWWGDWAGEGRGEEKYRVKAEKVFSQRPVIRRSWQSTWKVPQGTSLIMRPQMETPGIKGQSGQKDGRGRGPRDWEGEGSESWTSIFSRKLQCSGCAPVWCGRAPFPYEACWAKLVIARGWVWKITQGFWPRAGLLTLQGLPQSLNFFTW